LYTLYAFLLSCDVDVPVVNGVSSSGSVAGMKRSVGLFAAAQRYKYKIIVNPRSE
jgi:hypothetical protein